MSEETTQPTPPKIVAAFAVMIDETGNVLVERDPSVFTFDVERPAGLLEVRRYCSEIVMDLQAQAAAEYVFLAQKRGEEA